VDIALYGPVPRLLTAATLTFVVTFVYPGSNVLVVEVEPVAAAVAKVEPLSVVVWYTYPVIALPPFAVGAVHANESVVFVVLRVMVPIVGAPGTMFVTTTSDGVDAAPKSFRFFAVTLNL
jgi:hypothetical protein